MLSLWNPVVTFVLCVNFCQAKPDTCTAGFEKMPNHTMCWEDDPRVTSTGVSPEDQRLIVKFHNDGRRTIHGSDIFSLIWDDKIAEVAEKLAKQCNLEHDVMRNIPSYPGIWVGQNMAGGYGDWETAMAGWFDERHIYRFGEVPETYLGPNAFYEIGHYTQFVSKGAFRIGCGFATCANSTYTRYYVCNYGPGQENITHPYTRGNNCGLCPKSCKDGLCDCGGRFCLNKGHLDINTCKCRCFAKIWVGEDCGTLNCNVKDDSYCGNRWPEKWCRYVNISPLCPYMCGLCGPKSRMAPGTPCKGMWCYNGGTLDENTCSCSCRPGFTDRMCETIIPPCDGKKCLNWGSLNNQTCVCQCKNGFTGDLCQYPPKIVENEDGSKTCAIPNVKKDDKNTCKWRGRYGQDFHFCESNGGRVFFCEDCVRHTNVKTQYCPVMCGVCDPPCDSKRCYNGGSLNSFSCQCRCKKLFKGEFCEIPNCPAEEWHFCKYFPKDVFCPKYSHFPERCPFHCGVCER